MRAVLAFAVAALATWRLAKFLGQERGPFKLGAHLRRLLGGVMHEDDGSIAYDTDDTVLFHPDAPAAVKEIGRGLLCLWCCSIWVGALIAALIPRVTDYVTTALGLSAAAMLIEQWFNREGN